MSGHTGGGFGGGGFGGFSSLGGLPPGLLLPLSAQQGLDFQQQQQIQEIIRQRLGQAGQAPGELGGFAAGLGGEGADLGSLAQPALGAAGQGPRGLGAQQGIGLALAGLSALGALSQAGRRGPSAASSFDRAIRGQEQRSTAQLAARGLGFNPQAVAAASAPLRSQQAAFQAAEEERRQQAQMQAIGQLAALGLLLANPGFAPIAGAIPGATSFLGQSFG